MAIIGPVTSLIATRVASSGDKPFSILRSTFSTTTIASSTTIPMANTKPNNDKVLIETPNHCITANVPMSEIGTAISGIIDARHVCKNTITTITTSTIASSNVAITASIEPRTNTVGSYTMSYSTPVGKSLDKRAIVSRT